MEKELLLGFYRKENNGGKKNMEKKNINICFLSGKECTYEECTDISVHERDGMLIVDMSPSDEPFVVKQYFPLCNIESFRIDCEL